MPEHRSSHVIKCVEGCFRLGHEETAYDEPLRWRSGHIPPFKACSPTAARHVTQTLFGVAPVSSLLLIGSTNNDVGRGEGASDERLQRYCAVAAVAIPAGWDDERSCELQSCADQERVSDGIGR